MFVSFFLGGGFLRVASGRFIIGFGGEVICCVESLVLFRFRFRYFLVGSLGKSLNFFCETEN